MAETENPVSSPRNRIILGLLTFGPNTEWGAKVTSLDDFNACLDFFQSEGYNEVDTSRLYQNGQQEAFTAKAEWKERGLKLATKVYPTQPGAHGRQSLMDSVEESLRSLKTDSIDLFYLHAPDRSVPFTETLEAVNDLHQAGKIKELGISNFSAFEIAEIVTTCNERGWIRPTTCQTMYNALTRSIEPELIPACRRYGIDVVVYNPLAGGLFTGKFNATDPGQNAAKGSLSQVDKTYRARYLRNTSLEALRIIEPVVREHGLTLIETALRWLIHHSALRLRGNGDGNE
ncbi:hypothetical protein G7046_g251 [Stylonectria norvegica]|nr:hypothetical protein G7046_g251 [Stylonectria norvegica]